MRVADFGCGPGILGIGCALIGAEYIFIKKSLKF